MTKYSRAMARRSRRQGGVALVFVTVIFVILVGLVSLGVDYGKLRSVKAELRDTVDAAGRAAAGGLAVSPTEARTRAKAIAAASTVDGRALTLLDSDIEMGTWNASARQFTLLTGSNESLADAVHITGRLAASRSTDVKLMFLPVVGGRSSMDLTTDTICSRTAGSQDIVIVQDVSGSFSQEIAYARTGDLDLLDAVYAAGGTSSMGLVVFTGTAETVATLKSVGSNYSSLRSAISTVDVGGNAMPHTNSGTDIAAGMEAALSLFNAYSQTSPTRCMVIVSDGESTSSNKNAHPGLTDSELLDQARQDADTAWAANINVFVVFWDSANNSTSAANMASLVRGKGIFVYVTDPTKLSEAITNALKTTTMVK